MEGRGKGLVDRESVAGLDLLGLGSLHQDPLAGLAHRQRLGGGASLGEVWEFTVIIVVVSTGHVRTLQSKSVTNRQPVPGEPG